MKHAHESSSTNPIRIKHTHAHIQYTEQQVQMHAYSDDEKDKVILRLLIFPHRSIPHGRVQDGGEVGGTTQPHSVHSVLVGIYNSLQNG